MEKLENKAFHLSIPARASVFGVGSNLIVKALAVVFTSVFTRLLLPEEYGLYSLFASWLSILTPLATFSLGGSVLYRGMQKFRNDEQAFLSSTLSLSLTLSLLSLAIYLPLCEKVNALTGLSTALTVLIFVDIISGSAINFYLARCRYLYSYKKTFTLTLIQSLLWQAFAVLLITHTPYRSEGRIIASVAVSFIIAIPTFIYIFLKGKRFFSKKYWVFALKFNRAILPYHLAHAVLIGCDKIIIERLCGQSSLAKYSIGYSLGMLLTLAVNGINSALQPWLFRKLGAGEYSRPERLCLSLTRLISILTVLFVLFAPEALSFLAPKDYGEAILAVYPIALSVIPSFVFSVITSAKMYEERNLSTFISTAIAAALSIVLNLSLIPRLGYMTAAVISLICNLACVVLQYIISGKSVAKKLVNANKYLQISLFSIICVALAAFIRGNIYARAVSSLPLFLLLLVEGLALRGEIRERG